jgi:hypothetical protein
MYINTKETPNQQTPSFFIQTPNSTGKNKAKRERERL